MAQCFKDVKITKFDIVEDKHGRKTMTESVRVEDIPNPDGRHDVICADCGWSSYPECRKWCQGEQWWREKHPEEAAAFKKWWFETHPEDTEPFPEDQ